MKKRKIPSHLRLVKGGEDRSPVFEGEVKDFDSAAVRRAFIVRFGPSCAGWLIRDLDRRRKKRRQRFDGRFVMHLVLREPEPPWFQIAVGFLKLRRRKWKVETLVEHSVRRYWFYWVGGKPPRIPLAIRRLN